MALAPSAQGDQLLTVGTEIQVASDTVPGTYKALVDLGPLVSGDTVQVRLKNKIRSSGVSALGLDQFATFSGPLSDPTPAIATLTAECTLGQIALTIKQTAGVAKTVAFVLLRVQ